MSGLGRLKKKRSVYGPDNCPLGYTWNPVKRACLFMSTPCLPGFKWDKNTGQCHNAFSSGACPAGFAVTPDGQCVPTGQQCGEGYMPVSNAWGQYCAPANALSGLGDDEYSSEAEYQQAYRNWYYNQYLPWYRQQYAAQQYQQPYYGQQAYQPGWTAQQQGYGYAQQPYGYGQPQSYSQSAQDACMAQGGRWQDTGHGFVCSNGSTSANVSADPNTPPNVVGMQVQLAMNALSAQGWQAAINSVNGRYQIPYGYSNGRRVLLDTMNNFVTGARIG